MSDMHTPTVYSVSSVDKDVTLKSALKNASNLG